MFEWDYGNGVTATGTEDSIALWASTSYRYTTHGRFDVKLVIVSKTGCTDSFSISSAVANHILKPQIVKTYDALGGPKVCFSVDSIDYDYNPISQYQWNFGNPSYGQQNFNDQTLNPCLNFPLGPSLVSLNIRAGSCEVTVTDTIQILGPAAAIETVYNRITFAEKFQCGTTDSVHFTNASTFYHNDDNPADEDSIIVINGKSMFAFNYTPPTNGSGVGIGDQTPLASDTHIANRTMGSRVVRMWDFGDEYAPQCTTSLAKGLNIGVNCNYSEDEFPVHKYLSWDSIYYHSFFLTNHLFSELKYNDILNQCYNERIDTTNPTRHRTIFDETVQHKYNTVLELHDTISGYSSTDNVLIDFTKPNAGKMTKLAGFSCPFDGVNLSNINHFDLNTDGQSYFAVNYDTFTFDPNQTSSWNAFDAGGVYGMPPNIPLPFVLPYTIVGTSPDEFYRGYTLGQLGAPYVRTPEGSISMGIIVGNGPATSTQPATCLDTAYYHDIIRIKPLDASFETLSPMGSRKEICAGGDAYFKLNTESQDNIKFLRFYLGYPGRGSGRGPILSYYFEDFQYLQPYTGPKPNRNDASIIYNGENWLYNSVIRTNTYTIEGSNGHHTFVTDTIETIVTAIIKDWKTEAVYENNVAEELFINSIDYSTIPSSETYKLWGNGTNGCIDTTGYSDYLSIKLSEYRDYNDDEAVLREDKYYRYTNAAKTDSIEVAHILHFRDSSLQGYDTLIVGTDTTLGVWKISYTYLDSTDGQLQTLNANGPMAPGFTLTNTDGCDDRSAQYLNVGYSNTASVETPVYKEDAITLLDYIRNWQFGGEDYSSYPIDIADDWNNPSRVALGLETFKVDWDASNGITDWETGINGTLNNTYTQLGDYTITMASKDQNDCRDTFAFDITVLDRPLVTVDFIDSVLNPWDCNASVLLSDLSFVINNNCSIMPCDSIVDWDWTFSTGGTSTLQNPTLRTFNREDQSIVVKLVVTSANSRKDSVERTITVFAGNTPTKPDFKYSVNDKTLTSEVIGADPQSTYNWSWGDGSTSSGASSSNTYTNSGVYNTTITRTDTVSQCLSDTTQSIAIGGCNAYYGYEKDSSSTFVVLLLDSSTGNNLDYLWHWGDGNTSTSANPSHDYDTFGTYQVTLTVSNTNCSSTYSDSIGLDANGNLLKKDGFSIKVGTASTTEVKTNSAKVYPNPSDGNVTIVITKGKILNIEAFTIDGKKVSLTSTTKSPQEWDIKLDVARGRYVVVLSTSEGSVSEVVEVE
jgi:PKD repeat protein|tara:strand:+ start:1959 stop:5726 length:3768 start_codon:yes stop_codon:yes gene_type:complete